MDKKNLLEQLKEAVSNHNIYDFIANNYWQMSKEELKDIILELDFAIYSVVKNEKLKNDIYDEIDENLADRGVYDYE